MKYGDYSYIINRYLRNKSKSKSEVFSNAGLVLDPETRRKTKEICMEVERNLVDPKKIKKVKLPAGFPTAVISKRKKIFDVSGLIRITPKLANRLLETSGLIVKPDFNRAIRYAVEMERGDWKTSTSGLIFDEMGIIVNGVQTLIACCVSEKPIEMFVIVNAPITTWLIVDQLKPRNFSGFLKMHHVPYYDDIKKTATYLIRYGCTKDIDSTVPVPQEMILDYLSVDKTLVESVGFFKDIQMYKVYKNDALLTFCYHCFKVKRKRKAQEFFRELAKGEIREKYHPVNELRVLLLRVKYSESTLIYDSDGFNIYGNHTSGFRLAKSSVVGLTTVAFNHFVEGKPLKGFPTKNHTVSFPDQ